MEYFGGYNDRWRKFIVLFQFVCFCSCESDIEKQYKITPKRTHTEIGCNQYFENSVFVFEENFDKSSILIVEELKDEKLINTTQNKLELIKFGKNYRCFYNDTIRASCNYRISISNPSSKLIRSATLSEIKFDKLNTLEGEICALISYKMNDQLVEGETGGVFFVKADFELEGSVRN